MAKQSGKTPKRKGSSAPKKGRSSSPRKTNRKNNQKSTLRSRVVKFLLMGFICGLVLLSLFVGSIYCNMWGKLPDYHTLRNIKNATASEVYSEDGLIIGRIYRENRTNVSFKNISPHAINALIATEDARFYEHQGVDQRSLLRVFVKTLLLGNRSSGGGSTLSQQLAKNLYSRKNYGPFSMPVNKIREAITASRLEKIYTKKEILELYLNTVPFGERVFGIESASKRYFSLPASRLQIQQAAVLVGMLKAPSYYNPRTHPDRSLGRRNVVLNQMVKYEFITSAKAEQLKKLPLGTKYQKQTPNTGLAPYIREKIRLQVYKWLKENPKPDGSTYDIYTDGLKIRTTINSRLQKYAENAVRKQMTHLQKTFLQHWNNQDPWGKNEDVIVRAMKRSNRYKKLLANGNSEQDIKRIFNQPVKMKIFSWKGEKDVTMTPLDSIKYYQKILNTGFLAINPKNGKIKAWVGGIDFKHFKYDHVTAKRQVGSVFKPVVYAAALENGASPFKYYPNERKVYEEYENWSPRNADNNYEGKYSMEGALAESVNTIAVDVLLNTGIPNVIAQAEEMGIESRLPEVPSLALGSANISLLEMLQVYACFANRGTHVTPYYLARIEDQNGNVIKDFTLNREENRLVMSPDNADILTHMLQSVVDNGTAKSLRNVYGLTQELAGKTGTTQSQADGWYIGYSPDLVAGAWVGAEDIRVHFRSLSLGQGATMALPIYGNFMKQVAKDPKFRKYRYARFHEPDNKTLAYLNIPHYLPPNSNLFKKIFGWKEKERNPDKKLKKIEKRKKRRKNKKSIYDRIKNIFRKKD
ncbi:MAG: penicillin-binding protein 1A [Marinifilaceae bacterium]